MKPRSALVAAIACGAAAVLLVGADRAFSVNAILEVRAPDGSWKTAAELGAEQHPTSMAFCGTHFRLTLDNSLPWAATTDVTIAASGPGGERTLLDEPWRLGAGESRSHEFQVPNGTFESPGPRPDTGLVKGSGSVSVLLDHDYRKQLYASACLKEDA